MLSSSTGRHLVAVVSTPVETRWGVPASGCWTARNHSVVFLGVGPDFPGATGLPCGIRTGHSAARWPDWLHQKHLKPDQRARPEDPKMEVWGLCPLSFWCSSGRCGANDPSAALWNSCNPASSSVTTRNHSWSWHGMPLTTHACRRSLSNPVRNWWTKRCSGHERSLPDTRWNSRTYSLAGRPLCFNPNTSTSTRWTREGSSNLACNASRNSRHLPILGHGHCTGPLPRLPPHPADLLSQLPPLPNWMDREGQTGPGGL